MSLSFAIFTFINAWWIMLFCVLPLVIERGEHDSPVEYAAAPKKIYWRKAIALTTLLAAIITAGLALLIHSGLVPLRGMT